MGKFVKNNWKEISEGVALVGYVGKKAIDFRQSKKDTEQYQRKIHYRKTRHGQYKTEILLNLDNKKRNELFQAKLEVEQFIQQIKDEESKELVVKKPLHSQRINNWNEVLTQIEDKMAMKDYQEYLMIYNNPNYQSLYFEGFEGQIEKFKNLIDSQNTFELYEYLLTRTKRSKEDIKIDFLL
ncbi:hypothetical protein [Bacillus massilinigeriensis]|uniref:hypothetical protein n=1 Tax=Bacillus mediterraneensis TaxID=1805474 RepID=UPI00114D4353|nr:hypothetical protein [Bacillus mediterraneensis]